MFSDDYLYPTTMTAGRPHFRYLWFSFFVLACVTLFWYRQDLVLPIPSAGASHESSSPVAEASPTQADASSATYVNNDPIQTLNLPQIYNSEEEALSSCENRFGVPFLENFNSSATPYCTADSSAQATCFHITTEGERIDNLCIAGPASFSNLTKKFTLPCSVESGHSFSQLSRYWYSTGPGHTFQDFVDVQPGDGEAGSPTPSTGAKYALLIKREIHRNLWHSLMELFAATMSLDVLSIARDPRSGAPLLGPNGDLSQLRVIILDDSDDGPLYDLWSRFSQLPIQRLAEVNPDDIAGSQLIVPLAGGGNPFWQGDWEPLPCEESATLAVFVQRIFNWLDIPQQRTLRFDNPIRITYIDRRNQRKLFDQDAHVQSLKDRYPHGEVEVVDFAELSIKEQIMKARDSDVLIGVHGAGLTHAMFMDRATAVVEIMPEKLAHKGFRNMAKFRGLYYFGTHGSELPDGGDWHTADVSLDNDRYLHLIDAAVASVSNSGLRNDDIQK